VKKTRLVVKFTLMLLLLLTISTVFVLSVKIPSDSKVGFELINGWLELRGEVADINSTQVMIEEVLALTLFLAVIALTIIDMKLRYFAAFLAVATVTFLGVAPPQKLIAGVDWALILFLIGSMTLATVLRRLGVFTYLAAELVRLCRGSATLLIVFIGILAWFMAMVVDEVTSIVYVVMLIFELSRLVKFDPKELLIFSVLATNTGSAALPVGNPVSIYLAFATGLSARDFLVNAFPLSLINLIALLSTYLVLRRGYVKDLQTYMIKNRDGVEAYVTKYVVNLTSQERKTRVAGLAILSVFLALVTLTHNIAEALLNIAGFEVDPNALLAIVPYICLVFTAPFYDISEYSEIISRGVEWTSITFFMMLFMLSYSLAWSGVVVRLAYLMMESSGGVTVPNTLILNAVLVFLSAALSSVLDNLSLVAALTPAVKLIAAVLNNRGVFWGLLFGAVFGGNYTPIGSTANVVAISLSEKRKLRIGWGEWLKLALITTSAQLVIAYLWAFITR